MKGLINRNYIVKNIYFNPNKQLVIQKIKNRRPEEIKIIEFGGKMNFSSLGYVWDRFHNRVDR